MNGFSFTSHDDLQDFQIALQELWDNNDDFTRLRMIKPWSEAPVQKSNQLELWRALGGSDGVFLVLRMYYDDNGCLVRNELCFDRI